MRENGFYWVKFFGVWVIAEWDHIAWLIPGNECPQDHCVMEEVDENRIINTHE